MARLRPNYMALMKAVMGRRLPTSPNSRLANSTLPQTHSFWSAWSKVSDLQRRHDLRISSLGYLAWLSPWPCTPQDRISSPSSGFDWLPTYTSRMPRGQSTNKAEKGRIHLISLSWNRQKSLMCFYCPDMHHYYTYRSARYEITFSLVTSTYRMRRLHMSSCQAQSTWLKAIGLVRSSMEYWNRINTRLIFDEAGLHRRVWHERSIHNE